MRDLIIRGAREHNLDGVDVVIPRESLTVVTGVSGSGKSSLAFDTIYKEGYRRFVESLSAYARQFLGLLEKPDVELLDGLSPTLCIDQKTAGRNPRSTVGTLTEVYDYLRLLYARLGTPHCPNCQIEIQSRTAEQIAERIVADHPGARAMLLAPIVRDRKGEYREELAKLLSDGYLRVRIDGEVHRLDEGEISLGRYHKHTIEVVLDRLQISREARSRLTAAVERALQMADGVLHLLVEDGEVTPYATARACPQCGLSLPEMEPRLFSFNAPQGACPTCSGIGERREFDPQRIVPDENLSLAEGALACLTKEGRVPFTGVGMRQIRDVAKKQGFSLEVPWRKLPAAVRKALIHGDRKILGRSRFTGVIPELEIAYQYTQAPFLLRWARRERCRDCGGARLRAEARAVTFRGRGIGDLSAATVADCLAFFRGVVPTPREQAIGQEIFKELQSRLQFLMNVGLSYLSLGRSAATLSGGEAQRIRLASQVGSGLRGVLYILDEPSIGLHQRDNARLLETLARLRDQGNTVVVVEHDLDTIRAADHVIDIGPGAGRLGGRVVFEGPPHLLAQASDDSLTARYLRGDKEIEVPQRRPRADTSHLTLRGATLHNLEALDVSFPLGRFVVVTGVSGSGKSTLIDGVLRRALDARLRGDTAADPRWSALENVEEVDKVIEINQSPIGRTPRSNPATYTKVFDLIRDLYAQLPESRARGYPKGRFSFNVSGGRCEECRGAGVQQIELQFLAPVEVPCDECEGKRFNSETLEITYRGKNITDVLEMTIDEAREHFAPLHKIRHILDTMASVGLGYVHLGQPSTTLSGGEAQRVKLASELRRPATGKTLYILDEPTTGLHVEDVRHLLDALQRLVEHGNTVVVIEHNLDVVKVADHVIDLGPEGGAGGGRLVAEGTPEEVAATDTHTAEALREVLPGHAPMTLREPRRPPKSDTAFRGIRVVGARKHNLRSIDVEIPESSLTVVTGVSGSGKTSFAFDTLFAEGQRRYVESLSTYARRFLGRLDKAPVDRLEGLSPAIAIDQKTAPRTPRSTVATTTEIYDYLRIFFARVGVPHCPTCDVPLESHSPTAAARVLVREHKGRKGHLCAPLYRRGGPKVLGTAKAILEHQESYVAQGYLRVLVDGQERSLEEPLRGLSRVRALDLVLDRVSISDRHRRRLAESVEAAYQIAQGRAVFQPADGEEPVPFRRAPTCPTCDYVLTKEPHPRSFSFNSHQGACPECDGLGETWSGVCGACGGARLRPESLAVKIQAKNIIEVTQFTVADAQTFFGSLSLTRNQRLIAAEILREIRERLRFLHETGLEYITLDRPASTLSGGEAQRIRLASQLGLGLTGCLYVLDEPTVGLHPRDTERLLRMLVGLRDLGNTVVIVEHDPQTISAADRVIDLGPFAGEHGGTVVFAGTPAELHHPSALKSGSLTAAFLSGARGIPLPSQRLVGTDGVEVFGASGNNLKDIDASFRMGNLTCVTGVSGSGKSTLVLDTLERALAKDLGAGGDGEPCPHRKLTRAKQVCKVVSIDQSPLGRSPTSNPATYTGVFDPIRDLFASLPEAKIRGYNKGRFSFNSGAGQCPNCAGRGMLLVEMHFLSDVWITCDDCKGRRYNAETLAVTYRGNSIADILAMEVRAALDLFKNHRKISRILRTLDDVGLGYLRLGHAATTLSGGEAQRVKLATELCRRSRGDTIYILDEPTTGLHLADVDRLVTILRRLADQGNAVVVIEHNLEVIKVADRVIDLGPEAGDRGGEIVAQGTPEEVASSPDSATAPFLREALAAAPSAGAAEPLALSAQ